MDQMGQKRDVAYSGMDTEVEMPWEKEQLYCNYLHRSVAVSAWRELEPGFHSSSKATGRGIYQVFNTVPKTV